MAVHFEHCEYESKRLYSSISRVLQPLSLCSIATVKPEKNESHINTAYFCYSSSFSLYFLSDPETTHCRNIIHNPVVAVTFFDTNQPWGAAPLLGLQLVGHCSQTTDQEHEEATKLYGERFPSYVEYLMSLSKEEQEQFSSRFYVIRPTIVKILDEQEFGEENYVTVHVKVL